MKLAAIVLAAGSATRFGSDKLSAELHGKALVRHAIEAACAAPVEQVIVVRRPDLEIGDWPVPPSVTTIDIESEALSASLKAGIAAAADMDGAFIFLGDMPLVPHDVAGRLAAILDGHYAALPRHDGRPGHPVLLSAKAFPDIVNLQGDEGAGKLLRKRQDIIFDECPNSLIHLDIDCAEDLEKARKLDG